MREPPINLSEETLRACLRAEYGLDVTEVIFLPWGHDSSAWVYRVQATDGGTYFLKARLQVTNEASLVVPRYLHDHGVARVVAPLPTLARTLWTQAGDYAVILYPFIAGQTGMEQRMVARQWRDYGALLRQIHSTPVEPDLARLLQRDTFIPAWGDMVRRLDTHIGARTFADPLDQTLATFWQVHREEISTVLDRAEALGRRLAQAPPTFVLCHADIHTGNVLLDGDDQVWIVDWDETILAPLERDLMFVIGGISSTLVDPREEAFFHQGYGTATIDPLALAYYRYVWAVGDIGSFGEQVFFRPDFGPETRRTGVDYFTGLFKPGEIVALAFGSDLG